MTIHSLLLNLFKYIVYFAACGFILSEFGVNYKAYLASLSVIGLAIGFGSQGLVQDVVTGLFLVLEGQFAVGDLVEISGQTGYVEDVGLRMTRLRNYYGQCIQIPNRNIAMVGNYTRGAMQATIEIPLGGARDLDRLKDSLTTLVEEIGRQFEGVVLDTPTIVGPTVLRAGEVFLRMRAAL